jgi:hypothetical protein
MVFLRRSMHFSHFKATAFPALFSFFVEPDLAEAIAIMKEIQKEK